MKKVLIIGNHQSAENLVRQYEGREYTMAFIEKEIVDCNK